MAGQPTLRTDRLVLRAFGLSDAMALCALLSHPEVQRFLPDVPRDLNREACLEWIEIVGDAWNRRVAVVFAVELKAELVGGVQLQMGPELGEAEVGFWTRRERWGDGIAGEAVGCLVAWALDSLDLRCIRGRHTPNNLASGRVMLRAGFERAPSHEGGDVSYQCFVSGLTQKMRNGMAMNQHPPHMNPKTDRMIP